MKEKPLPRIKTPTESLVLCYPAAHHYQDLQQDGFWTANEVSLEKDIQPILTEIVPAEKHGILTVLKLFSIYESRADEFWSDVIKKMFPRPEIQEMAALFSAMELSVHRRVYDKLNQLLDSSSDEFYAAYKQNKAMKDRMEFLDKHLQSGHDLTRIAAFCFAEGVILFSNFAYLMSYRANGVNKLPNIGLAIKFSSRDEDNHCSASAWLFRQLRLELDELGEDTSHLDDIIYEIANVVREHEYEILAEVFSHGKKAHITETQMRHFVDSRIDVVLTRMGLKKIHNVKYNPVAEWFDKIVESYQYVDFFAGQGSSYTRGWDEDGFVWSYNKETV